MRFIFLLGVIFGFFMLAGSASAGNQIDTSDIYIMAYYKMLPEVDLSQVIQEFDSVRESTGQYVEGTITIWHNYRNGRDTGEGLDVEVIDGVVTGVPFSTDVNVRVKSDGWVAVWLTNEQDMGDMIFWDRVDQHFYPPDTTLGQAIWRVTNRMGTIYDKNRVGYYSYEYPNADRLLIGGRTLCLGGISSTIYHFLIPSGITLYESEFLWTSYLENYYAHNPNYAIVKMNYEEYYNKNSSSFGVGLYNSMKYSSDISTFPRDIRHTVYMEDSGWVSAGRATLKSVVALLYKSG